MNTQDMISIKAKHQNEIRRFALPLKSTYATLETSLNSLFTLSSPVIKYTDDEGDLCTISTQQEFDYAVSTTKGLLRLHLFSPEDLKASTTASSFSAPVSTSAPQIPLSSSQECPQKHFLLEKMDNKHAQLISKRDDLKSKLASDSLNSERRRVLSWKLEKIEGKISMLEQRRKNMAYHLQNPGEGGHHHGPWRGGARGGRGARGPHHGPGHFEHGSHQDWPHHGPPPHHHDWPHHAPHHDWPHHGPPHHHHAGPGHFEHHVMPPHQHNFDEQQGGHPHPHHQQKEQRWLDWMDKRQANLTSKRDSLNAKIAEEGITPQRKEILTEKLKKVQDKLTALELRRQQLADGVHPCVKGAGRRGGRGGWGKHAGQCEQQQTADSTTPKNEETK